MDACDELGAPGASHLGGKHTDGFTFRRGLGWKGHLVFSLIGCENYSLEFSKLSKTKE
jgi:hypothetical protein